MFISFLILFNFLNTLFEIKIKKHKLKYLSFYIYIYIYNIYILTRFRNPVIILIEFQNSIPIYYHNQKVMSHLEDFEKYWRCRKTVGGAGRNPNKKCSVDLTRVRIIKFKRGVYCMAHFVGFGLLVFFFHVY